ncbi:MAG: LysM peptidoglycan-binding domain-containing protein [Lachnospiraceae bacterium]|nr:LysM peptidoglycan-binding domain-containing protein [Lachnospiraceae bacterium]
MSFIINVRSTFAKATQAPDNNIKCYKSITIYCGDTRTSISKEYYTGEWDSVTSFTNEIKKINHISNDDYLIAGNYLTIPYYKEIH